MSSSLFYFYISGFAGTLAPFFGGLFVLLIIASGFSRFSQPLDSFFKKVFPTGGYVYDFRFMYFSLLSLIFMTGFWWIGAGKYMLPFSLFVLVRPECAGWDIGGLCGSLFWPFVCAGRRVQTKTLCSLLVWGPWQRRGLNPCSDVCFILPWSQIACAGLLLLRLKNEVLWPPLCVQ